MDWDEIRSAKYEKLNRISPHLAELKTQSAKRTSSDRDFAYLAEEIKRANEAREEKSTSLNEQKRLTEKKEADERAKKRKKELAARPEPPGKVYEITLKNVDIPGLPAPVTPTNSVKTARTAAVPLTAIETAKAGGPTANTENTNALARSPAMTAHPTEKDAAPAEDEEQAPKVDITLEETKRILLDLVRLSNNGNILAVAVPKEKKTP